MMDTFCCIYLIDYKYNNKQKKKREIQFTDNGFWANLHSLNSLRNTKRD